MAGRAPKAWIRFGPCGGRPWSLRELARGHHLLEAAAGCQFCGLEQPLPAEGLLGPCLKCGGPILPRDLAARVEWDRSLFECAWELLEDGCAAASLFLLSEHILDYPAVPATPDDPYGFPRCREPRQLRPGRPARIRHVVGRRPGPVD